MSQLTFKLKNSAGEVVRKVKIKTRARSSVGNFAGWSVFIDGVKYFSNVLEEYKAIENCYFRWVKTQPCIN